MKEPIKLCAIPGDGVGLEVVPAAIEILKAVLPELQISHAQAGWDVFEETGTSLPDSTLQQAQSAGAILFGAVSSPLHSVSGYNSPIVELRQKLDTFANIRPAKKWLTHDINSLPDTGSSSQNSKKNKLDLLVVRENTEGLYSGKETVETLPDLSRRVVTERSISEKGSERLARVGFELAFANESRRRLTIIHKANVIRQGDGLWRSVCLKVSKEYPTVEVDECLVDSSAYHMVQNPSKFDLLLCPNLYGDILSDLASGLADGLGMAPSISLGQHFAIAEPVHGSAPDIAGKGIANPIAAILSGALLCRYWWKKPDAADRIEKAITCCLKNGFRTPDIGGSNTTKELTNAILVAIKEQT